MAASLSSQREAAAERLATRRRRVRRIRARVAGFSLATFLAASGAVLVQLVTGRTPAQAHTTSATRAQADRVSAAASATTSHRSAAASRHAVSPSPVTTSAS